MLWFIWVAVAVALHLVIDVIHGRIARILQGVFSSLFFCCCRSRRPVRHQPPQPVAFRPPALQRAPSRALTKRALAQVRHCRTSQPPPPARPVAIALRSGAPKPWLPNASSEGSRRVTVRQETRHWTTTTSWIQNVPDADDARHVEGRHIPRQPKAIVDEPSSVFDEMSSLSTNLDTSDRVGALLLPANPTPFDSEPEAVPAPPRKPTAKRRAIAIADPSPPPIAKRLRSRSRRAPAPTPIRKR